MLRKIIVVLLVVLTSKLSTANSVTINQVPISPQVKTIEQLIDEKALQYGVSADRLTFFIKCESGFNPQAKNISSVEASYGLSQINTKAHSVTIEQATDPNFAVSFMAENFSKGKYNMWYNCNQKWLRLNEIQ